MKPSLSNWKRHPGRIVVNDDIGIACDWQVDGVYGEASGTVAVFPDLPIGETCRISFYRDDKLICVATKAWIDDHGATETRTGKQFRIWFHVDALSIAAP